MEEKMAVQTIKKTTTKKSSATLEAKVAELTTKCNKLEKKCNELEKKLNSPGGASSNNDIEGVLAKLAALEERVRASGY